jgi:hypothetical protein
MRFPHSLIRVVVVFLIVTTFGLTLKNMSPATAQTQNCALDFGTFRTADVQGSGVISCTFDGKAGDKVIPLCDGCTLTFFDGMLDPNNKPVDYNQPLPSSGRYTVNFSFSISGGQRCNGPTYPTEGSCGYGCTEISSSAFGQAWCPNDQVVDIPGKGTISFGLDRAFKGIQGTFVYDRSFGKDTLFTRQVFDVYRLQPNGDEVELTQDGHSGQPNLAPDGSQIVYSVFQNPTQDAGGQIYVMNADGSNAHALTHGNFDSAPVWSPDGKQILFMSSRDSGNFEVYVMDANGDNPHNLTNDPAKDRYPRWSPDGSHIYFHSDRSSGRYQIFVMNADGSDVKQLTTDDGSSTNARPIPSPDGKKIVFDTDRDKSAKHSDNTYTTEIYMMNVDGSEVQRLTERGQDEFPIAWSPDSSQIVYISDYGRLMVMNADGSDAQRVMMFSGASTGGGASWIDAAPPAQTSATTPDVPHPSGESTAFPSPTDTNSDTTQSATPRPTPSTPTFQVTDPIANLYDAPDPLANAVAIRGQGAMLTILGKATVQGELWYLVDAQPDAPTAWVSATNGTVLPPDADIPNVSVNSANVPSARSNDTPTIAPTDTPIDIPTATDIPATATRVVPQATVKSCPNTLPSRLVIGGQGVVAPGDPNRIRSKPTVKGGYLGQMLAGDTFVVLDGPVCADGYAWWKVNYQGLVGWSAESGDGQYWLLPSGS